MIALSDVVPRIFLAFIQTLILVFKEIKQYSKRTYKDFVRSDMTQDRFEIISK